MPKKQQYLDYVKVIAENVWKNHEAKEEKGDCAYLVYLAYADSALYHYTKESMYAKRARKAILDLEKYRDARPGHLPFDILFDPYPYMQAVGILKEGDFLTAEELKIAEDSVAEVLREMLRYPEWGAHNRAMLRAINLLKACTLFPDHPDYPRWCQTHQVMSRGSFGKFTIEDGSTYNPIWLSVLFRYADLAGRTEEINSAYTTQYYCNYLLQMLNPRFIPTEYGDGRWGSCWCWYAGCLERGAAIYQDPQMKYAVDQLFEAMLPIDTGMDAGWMVPLINCYEWADDNVPQEIPTSRSMEVLDDIITKKLVFRDGWQKDSTYFFLNYKDEGTDSVFARNHLRDTLFVTAEKAHHGHSDINSIGMYLHQGSVMLHDGGYRTDMKYVGAFRADYYHNKLIARRGIYYPDVEEGIIDFYRHFRNYYPAVSEKLYFDTFDKVEVSRTRVLEKVHGIEADRLICYMKELDFFIVVDFVKALEDGEYTYGPLYFSRNVEQIRENAFLTYYDYIGTDEMKNRQIPNDASKKLLIYYPQKEYPCATQTISRSYTYETGIQQYFSGWQKHEEVVPMVSVLIPTSGDAEEMNRRMNAIQVTVHPDQKGLTIEVESAEHGCRYILGSKLDPRLGIGNLNIRPTYNYELGKVNYAGIETDADFGFVRLCGNQGEYGFLNATKFDFHGVPLFEMEIYPHYQIDLSYRDACSKWEKWEETFVDKGGQQL
jgi:hypothetical protein